VVTTTKIFFFKQDSPQVVDLLPLHEVRRAGFRNLAAPLLTANSQHDEKFVATCVRVCFCELQISHIEQGVVPSTRLKSTRQSMSFKSSGDHSKMHDIIHKLTHSDIASSVTRRAGGIGHHLTEVVA